MQANFHMEQQRQQLQQQAAGLSARVHSLAGRCEDAEADAQALQHRLGLEAEQVRVPSRALHQYCMTKSLWGMQAGAQTGAAGCSKAAEQIYASSTAAEAAFCSCKGQAL